MCHNRDLIIMCCVFARLCVLMWVRCAQELGLEKKKEKHADAENVVML